LKAAIEFEAFMLWMPNQGAVASLFSAPSSEKDHRPAPKPIMAHQLNLRIIGHPITQEGRGRNNRRKHHQLRRRELLFTSEEAPRHPPRQGSHTPHACHRLLQRRDPHTRERHPRHTYRARCSAAPRHASHARCSAAAPPTVLSSSAKSSAAASGSGSTSATKSMQ